MKKPTAKYRKEGYQHRTVVLGKGKATYQINTLSESLRARLQTWVSLGEYLAKCKACKTWQEYKEAFDGAMRVVKGPPRCAGMQGSSMWLLVGRSLSGERREGRFPYWLRLGVRVRGRVMDRVRVV